MEFDAVKDSGERQEFGTGSVRDNPKGKGRYDLLPTRAMRRLAQHFENGAAKYGDRNWEKGQPLSRYLDSALRHTFALLECRDDEDHAAAGAWNLLCFIETFERIDSGQLPDALNDLPVSEPRFIQRDAIDFVGYAGTDPAGDFISASLIPPAGVGG